MQQLHEALGAAKTRVESCSSFLRAAIKLDFLASLFFYCEFESALDGYMQILSFLKWDLGARTFTSPRNRVS